MEVEACLKRLPFKKRKITIDRRESPLCRLLLLQRNVNQGQDQPRAPNPMREVSPNTVPVTEKPWCDICSKRFSCKTSLKSHLRIHSGDKPFGCEVCGKRFRDMSTKIKHLRIHSGDKPYPCLTCGHRFSQAGNMRRHVKAIHEQFHYRYL